MVVFTEVCQTIGSRCFWEKQLHWKGILQIDQVQSQSFVFLHFFIMLNCILLLIAVFSFACPHTKRKCWCFRKASGGANNLMWRLNYAISYTNNLDAAITWTCTFAQWATQCATHTTHYKKQTRAKPKPTSNACHQVNMLFTISIIGESAGAVVRPCVLH